MLMRQEPTAPGATVDRSGILPARDLRLAGGSRGRSNRRVGIAGEGCPGHHELRLFVFLCDYRDYASSVAQSQCQKAAVSLCASRGLDTGYVVLRILLS